jgi:hypothetical protein
MLPWSGLRPRVALARVKSATLRQIASRPSTSNAVVFGFNLIILLAQLHPLLI